MLTISSLYRGGGVQIPSIAYVTNSNQAHYHPYVPPPPPGAGAIVYKSGSDLLTVDYTLWDNSMGTPVGVLVIPSGFAPDGKARMLSLNWASESSTSSTSASGIMWSNVTVDTSLINYNCVPTTDNAGSTTTGSNSYGYLPSDKFTGAISYVDPTAKYDSTSNMIPSPYLGDKPNPAYYAPISGKKNALADFDGKGNTDVLVALGSDYVAANAARNYKAAGAEEIEWYLPAIGELVYIISRFNKIQAALMKVNASQLDDSNSYWSSSEYWSNIAYTMNTHSGGIGSSFTKNKYDLYVRPFALLA